MRWITIYNYGMDCNLQSWGGLKLTIMSWIAAYNHEVAWNLQSWVGLEAYNHEVDCSLQSWDGFAIIIHSRGGLQFTITGWIGTHYPNAVPNTIVLWLRVHLPAKQRLQLLQWHKPVCPVLLLFLVVDKRSQKLCNGRRSPHVHQFPSRAWADEAVH